MNTYIVHNLGVKSMEGLWSSRILISDNIS